MGKQAKRERKETERANSTGEDHSLTPADKRFASTLKHLARGVIIGGSVAVLIGLLFPEANMGRIVGLGLLSGCLAGITMKSIHDRKQGR